MVDYGNETDVEYADMRKDVCTVDQIERLSHLFVLKDVVYLGERGDATLFLHKQLAEKMVDVQVLEKPLEEPEISGYAVIKKNGVDMRMILQAEGKAKWAKEE